MSCDHVHDVEEKFLVFEIFPLYFFNRVQSKGLVPWLPPLVANGFFVFVTALLFSLLFLSYKYELIDF